MTEAQSLEASGITGMMLIGVVLIPWLTLAISEVFLFFYRRAVVRAMGAQRSARASASPAAAPLAPREKETPLAASTDTSDTQPASGGVLYERFRHATRATAVVYATAGVMYAGFMAVAMGVQSGTLSLASWLAYAVAFAWPIVLTALLIIAPHRRARIVAAYFVVFLLGAVVPPTRWFLFAIFFANAAATIVGLVVRARRIHAVAPLVGAVLTIVGAAQLCAVAVAASFGESPGTAGAAATSPGAGESFLFLGELLMLFIAGPVAAWIGLRVVAALYGRKRTSDQAIAMAALWITFAGIQATTFGFSDARWVVAGLVAFLAFSIVAATGFWLLRRRAVREEHGPRLLVLRVFALGRRSRRLFDQFTQRWRHIGSVQLIAGPDLASSTVEPHEFLDFLRRRLGHRFLDSAESIDRALTQLDTDPDPDGRYRITDFICRDHAWRTVFRRLASDSDVVLMDLRGFSPANAGCTYEVGELLNVVPFERITIVVDPSTDAEFLARMLDEARARLSEHSPNFSTPELQVRMFRETGRHGLDPDGLFRLLCDTALLPRRRDEQVAHAS